jgi:acyl-CoA thioesterase
VHLITTWGDLASETGTTIYLGAPNTLDPPESYPVSPFPSPTSDGQLLPWAKTSIGVHIIHREVLASPSLSGVKPTESKTGIIPRALQKAENKRWIKFKDNRPIDTLSLSFFADAFTPPLIYYYRDIPEVLNQYFPTMEINIQFRARPKDGYIHLITNARFVVNGRHEIDGELYDESGTLVALMR